MGPMPSTPRVLAALLRIAGFAVVVLPLAAPSARAEDDSTTHMDPAELLRLVEAGEAPTIVDVRSRGEFERGHVPGALHIPFYSAWSRGSEIPTPPQEAIVVYCEHGPRAGLAKAGFRLAGFERVLYLKGHMTGWKKAGLPQEATEPLPPAVPPERETP